jgi:SSS family solute:Na+ symporter
LDIYKTKLNVDANEKKLVNIGKKTIIVAMLIAVVVAPFLGIDKKGGFQYIQEYTGFVSPGVFAMFIFGFFWKKTTSNAALFATIGGFLLSLLFKFMPAFVDLSFLNPMSFSVPNANGVFEIPFIDRMGFVFLICAVGMYIISIYETRKGVQTNGLEIDKSMFKMSPSFTIGMLVVLSILAAFYTIFW